MKVYTYFDANLDIPDQGKIIRHWFLSWRNNGWKPHMLTPRTFSRHPLRKKFLWRAKNDPDKLNAARAARWLAIVALRDADANVIFSEYDVINYGFAPEEHLTAGSFSVSQSGGFMDIAPWVARDLLEQYLEQSPRVMTMGLLPHSAHYNKWEWRKAKLVHFSSCVLGGESKHTVIENCGRLY